MAKEEIYIGNITVKYGQGPPPNQSRVFKADSFLLRSPVGTVLFPGEELKFTCPDHFSDEVAVEPRFDSPLNGQWPVPSFLQVDEGLVKIPNGTSSPIEIVKNQHIGNIRQVELVDILPASQSPTYDAPHKSVTQSVSKTANIQDISLDPDNQLSMTQRKAFLEIKGWGEGKAIFDFRVF